MMEGMTAPMNGSMRTRRLSAQTAIVRVVTSWTAPDGMLYKSASDDEYLRRVEGKGEEKEVQCTVRAKTAYETATHPKLLMRIDVKDVMAAFGTEMTNMSAQRSQTLGSRQASRAWTFFQRREIVPDWLLRTRSRAICRSRGVRNLAEETESGRKMRTATPTTVAMAPRTK